MQIFYGLYQRTSYIVDPLLQTHLHAFIYVRTQSIDFSPFKVQTIFLHYRDKKTKNFILDG